MQHAPPIGSICMYPAGVPNPNDKPYGFLEQPRLRETADDPGKAPVQYMDWIPCDGRELPVSEYPELYAVLGDLYGGSSGKFNVPDYRGTFIRGVDSGSGVDPDVEKRKAAKNGEPTGVGSTQSDAFLTHTHNYMEAGTPNSFFPGGATALTVNVSVPSKDPNAPSEQISDYETRPKNVAAWFIIRAK